MIKNLKTKKMDAIKIFWRIDLGGKVALINPEQVISVELYKNKSVVDNDGVIIRLSKHLFYKVTKKAWLKKDVIKMEE